MRLKLTLIFAFIFSALAIGLVSTPSVSALSGNDFKAGRIIDDAIFYNRSAMSVTEIQNFLNAKVPTCDTNGTKMYNSTQTRKQYAASKGVSTPFICLKSYTQNTPYKAGESGLCSAINAKTNRSSANIINDVAQACGVSAKVLLVLLNKEQSLVVDDWPWPIQYRSATGYGCPDTAACDSEYYGFFNQVYHAALQYKRYQADPDNWNHIPFMTNQIWYQANAPSCGKKSVYIENQATAGLYNYTPYTPNKAALDNLYGTGNSCSAYGNRNFWRMFNDWFGPTYKNLGFTSLKSPRWMQTKTDIQKRDARTNVPIGDVIPEGTQIYFNTKVTVNGNEYLRTEHDSARNYEKGILYSDLEEISITYEPLKQPRWLETNVSLRKINPLTRTTDSRVISSGTQIYFPTKVTIGGEDYLRTQNDTILGHSLTIPMRSLGETSIAYVSLKQPRWMQSSRDIYLYDILNTENVGDLFEYDSQLYFDRKILINGVWYLRNGLPVSSGDPAYSGFRLDALKEINLVFSALKYPRQMKTKTGATKINLRTNEPSTDSVDQLTAGQVISFTTKTEIDGKIYLRTEHDSKRGYEKGILYSDLEEINP